MPQRRNSPGQAIGEAASFLRIDPLMGCIEVGHLCYAPALQQTAASTEAMSSTPHEQEQIRSRSLAVVR
jgi:hypothetical protein